MVANVFVYYNYLQESVRYAYISENMLFFNLKKSTS